MRCLIQRKSTKKSNCNPNGNWDEVVQEFNQEIERLKASLVMVLQKTLLITDNL